jgi:antagonist of KipI
LRPGTLDSLAERQPIRATKGAQKEQKDWFGPDAFATLFGNAYQIMEQSNRTGLRLKGESIRPQEQSQLVSDGNPLGAIQVPQGGQPIILLIY